MRVLATVRAASSAGDGVVDPALAERGEPIGDYLEGLCFAAGESTNAGHLQLAGRSRLTQRIQ
jgi:hypothetical protein